MNFNKYKFLKKKFDVRIQSSNEFILLKKLIFNIKKSTGRDKQGQLLYHRGGGVKKKFRLINFNTNSKSYRILQQQYDPYRSAFINLIQYKTGELSYVLSSSNNIQHQIINYPKLKKTNNSIALASGLCLPLYKIPAKTIIFNVEIKPNSGALLARAAGSFCKVFRKDNKTAELIIPSGKHIKVPLTCKAYIGIASNSFNKLNKKYKASTNRFLNRRPTVRGVAMNPIDHPHGGGEGKSTSGRSCVSPWGKLTKNVPTRNKKKTW